MDAKQTCATYERFREERERLKEEIEKKKQERKDLENSVNSLKNEVNYRTGHVENAEKGMGLIIGLVVFALFVILAGLWFWSEEVIEGLYVCLLGLLILGGAAHLYYTEKVKAPVKKKEAEEALAKCQKDYEECGNELWNLKKKREDVPSLSACLMYERNLEIAALSGTQKREKMLEDRKTTYREEREFFESRLQDKMSRAGSLIGYKEQETNWAVMGGIAAGIAGPVAGAMNALSIQAEEKARTIRKHKAGEEILASASYELNILQELGGREETLAKYETRSMDGSVISDVSSEEITKHLDCYFQVKNPDSALLEITGYISLKKPLPSLRTRKKKAVVDGTLQVVIKGDDAQSCIAYLPLPLEGLPCNSAETVVVYGYALAPQNHTGEYTIELSKEQNLWVMDV